jgi:hypothetical protein
VTRSNSIFMSHELRHGGGTKIAIMLLKSRRFSLSRRRAHQCLMTHRTHFAYSWFSSRARAHSRAREED